MNRLAVLFAAGTALCAVLFQATRQSVFLTIAITLGTFFYHFAMRLAVGGIVNAVMHNRADLGAGWFRQRGFEKRLYERLRVGRWKGKMPAYDPDLFDPAKHTWEEIAQAMCQAELVHEIIIVLSFVLVFAGAWFGAYPVFIATSVLAACFDLCFVMLQRYNRPRIVMLAERLKRRNV